MKKESKKRSHVATKKIEQEKENETKKKLIENVANERIETEE